MYFLNHSAAPNHLGGSELSLLHLVHAWGERDPEFVATFISPTNRGAFTTEVRRRGHSIFAVPFEGWALFADPGGRPEAALRVRRDFASTRRIIAKMREHRPDLVVTNTVVSPWGAYAAAALGIPHVWFVREFADATQGFRFPAGRDTVLRDVGLLSALVVANSETLRSSLTEFIPADKLVYNYPGIDLGHIRALSREPLPMVPFSLPDAMLSVVVVGRITRTKGQWRVVEAIGRLRARGLRIAVCFVGAAVEADAEVLLARRAAQLGVADSITFVGEQVNPFPFVRAADVGITPSDREAFGRVTLEYLALGKPVLATASGGSLEVVVDGETGFLVDPEDIDELAERLERLALDRALLAEQSRGATVRAEQVAGSSDLGSLIELLTATAATPGLVLPATVVDWLDAPELFSSPTLRGLRVFVGVRHLGRRLLAALRHPRAVLRRRWLRARRSRLSSALPRHSEQPRA
ncbi:MAG: glycosyltransferase [Pseudolysinimonas sp.]